MKPKVDKNCCVRLPPLLHKGAKILAVKEGKKLQDWVANLIEEKLKQTYPDRDWLCQECGKWKLENTQMAVMGKCNHCLKKDVAVFPC